MRAADRPLLAFDTSTEAVAIALCGPFGMRLWNGPGGPLASAQLLPRAAALMTEAGLGWRELVAVAFGAGPGAFTGLRTACAAAQGLALGVGCPVVPVDSLAIVAEDAAAGGCVADGEWLWVAMDARMGEVYAAAYRRDGADWTALHRPALYTPAALNAIWDGEPPALIAGSALAALGDLLAPGDARRVDRETDRAAALGRLALRLHGRGDAVDAALAQPVYLRDKVALTSAERAAAKAAA